MGIGDVKSIDRIAQRLGPPDDRGEISAFGRIQLTGDDELVSVHCHCQLAHGAILVTKNSPDVNEVVAWDVLMGCTGRRSFDQVL